MERADIINAYCKIRTIDQTIPDDVLDFMKNASIAALEQPLHSLGKNAEEVLCEIWDCELRDLQVDITLNPDKNKIIKAMEEYASQSSPFPNEEEIEKEAIAFLEWTEKNMWTRWENLPDKFKYADGWYNTHNYDAMKTITPITTEKLYSIYKQGGEEVK